MNSFWLGRIGLMALM